MAIATRTQLLKSSLEAGYSLAASRHLAQLVVVQTGKNFTSEEPKQIALHVNGFEGYALAHLGVVVSGHVTS
jgi:hypothetical protein